MWARSRWVDRQYFLFGFTILFLDLVIMVDVGGGGGGVEVTMESGFKEELTSLDDDEGLSTGGRTEAGTGVVGAGEGDGTV